MAYLLIETPEGTRRVELARDRLTVGRLAESDVPLPYAQISRQHAELRRFNGEWWIRDLGSTNGLHLGAHRLQQHRLASGDRILLSPDVALRYVDDASSDVVAGGPERTSRQAGPFHSRASAGPPVGPRPSAAQTAGPSVPGGSDTQDPYRRTMPAQRSPIAQVPLHMCQTCGRRTAPDVELCYACHQSIAHPCDVCRASLLPAQERCPRCQTPNPAYVGRTNPRPAG